MHCLVKKKGTSCNGWKTGGFFILQRKWKKSVKKCWQGGGGVVLYLSAKRWGKRMTSKASAGSPWKEPIDAEKFQFVLRNFLDVQVQKVQKLLKNKAWQKTTSVVKWTGRQPQGWGATGPWKLNNIEKLVRNLYVFGKTLKTIPKVIHTGRKRLRAERTRFNTFKW